MSPFCVVRVNRLRRDTGPQLAVQSRSRVELRWRLDDKSEGKKFIRRAAISFEKN